MTLVEVISVDLEAKRPQEPKPTDPEDDVRESPVCLAVLFELSVEKQDRDLVPVRVRKGSTDSIWSPDPRR